MSSRHLFLVLACLGLTLAPLSAQKRARIRIDTRGEVHPWNHLDLNNSPAQFQFAIVTDRTGGHRPGVFPTAISKLNLLQPEFVMSVGDLIEGYTTDTARIRREWEEFTGFIDQLQMPFFYVPGNHDYINETMAAAWKARFGRDYYHFVYQDVLFLCLNSEERMRGAGRGYIDAPQLAYIQEALAANPKVKWTLVFLHQPLWDQEDAGLWPEVETLLASRPHTVFAGHRHRYVKHSRPHGGKYFVLATTGGGSSLRGPRFGEFDHVVWVTMTDQGPILANLLLDGIWDENVHTDEMMAFSGPLMGRQAIRPEPLLAGSAEQLVFRITNDSDVPMAWALEFASHPTLWVQSSRLADTLPPNQTQVVSVPLQQAGPVEDPVQVTTMATYLPEDQPALELVSAFSLQPEALRPLGTGAVTIDGRLDDWGSLRFDSEQAVIEADPFSHRDVDDARFAWDVRYDAAGLYLGARVIDSDLVLEAGDSPWNQDGLAFLVDARPLDQSALNDGEAWFQTFLPLAVGPAFEGEGPGRLFRPENLPEGTRSYCRRTATGYEAEVFVPISYLEQQQGPDWQHLRINLILRDVDDEGIHESQLIWLPAWNSDPRPVGNGLFRRP